MPRLNVMGELREILESALGGVSVRVDLPGERPGTVAVVRRCGGARQDALVDSPQVEVLMWAPTEAEAEGLAERVGDAMSRLPFARGFCACEEFEMRTDYDYFARSPRWYALYRLKTYQPKEG